MKMPVTGVGVVWGLDGDVGKIEFEPLVPSGKTVGEVFFAPRTILECEFREKAPPIGTTATDGGKRFICTKTEGRKATFEEVAIEEELKRRAA